MKLNFALLYLVGALFAVEVMDGSGAGFATVVGNMGGYVSDGDAYDDGAYVDAGNYSLGGAVLSGSGLGYMATGVPTQ